jgi:DNA-binding beta-propeller fold protein YncE
MKAIKPLVATVFLLLTFSLPAPAFSQEVYKFELMWGSQGTGDGQFYHPSGLAVDSSGNVYVADTGNNRIQKFDLDGNYITKWGSYGTGDGQFSTPSDVAVDSLGNVYVADTDNHRVQKFDSDGKSNAKWDIPITDGPFFAFPSGVATDLFRNVYVANLMVLTIPITPPPPIPNIMKFDANGNLITKWGSFGTAGGQFNDPNGVAVDSSGNVYVADWGNDCLQKFDSNGNFITKWRAGPMMLPPYKVAIDRSENMYTIGWFIPLFVGPTNQFRIQKFDSNGNLIAEWGDLGNGDGQFDGPSGISVDPLGNVYVSDSGNNRIQKFSLTLPSITLRLPSINEHFNACSLNSPPAFSWSVSEAFNDYEVQFSPDRIFTSISFEFGVQSPVTQIIIPSNTWEEIMMIPGGISYWRVIGTRTDGTTETSAVRSFSVGAEPAGNLNISPTKKRSRPTLTWEKNCNTKFKVVFGNDTSFMKRSYSIEIENPDGSEGTFSKTLTLLEWLKIKMLVKNKSDSTIYWFVESWDGLGRYAKTDVMSFVLTD